MSPNLLLSEGVMKEEKRKVALERERRQQTMLEVESGLDPVLELRASLKHYIAPLTTLQVFSPELPSTISPVNPKPSTSFHSNILIAAIP